MLGAGLNLLENAARGRGDNAMGWVSLASAALFDSKAVSPNLTTTGGDMNWQFVAVQAVGSAIVGSRMGEDAGLNYFGQGLGGGLAEDAYRDGPRMFCRAAGGERAKAIGNALGSSLAEGTRAARPDAAERFSERWRCIGRLGHGADGDYSCGFGAGRGLGGQRRTGARARSCKRFPHRRVPQRE